MLVGLLRAAGRKGDEQVAHVDEGHAAAAAAQRELEDPPVELERLADIADLEGDVIQANQSWAWHNPMLSPLTGL
jgi:hypothetical protein